MTLTSTTTTPTLFPEDEHEVNHLGNEERSLKSQYQKMGNFNLDNNSKASFDSSETSSSSSASSIPSTSKSVKNSGSFLQKISKLYQDRISLAKPSSHQKSNSNNNNSNSKPSHPASSNPSSVPLGNSNKTLNKWAQKYEIFLLSNASRLANIESSIRSLSYLATGQMHDVELVTETLYSMLQILGLYHDRVINRAIQDLATSSLDNNSDDDNEPKHRLIGDPQAIRPSMHNRYIHWAMNKGKMYRYCAIILTLLRQTELLWEMVGKRGYSFSFLGTEITLGKKNVPGTSDHKASEKGRWKAILYIESIKAILRLGMLISTQGRTLMDSPIIDRDIDPQRIVRTRKGDFTILDENDIAGYKEREQQREFRRLVEGLDEDTLIKQEEEEEGKNSSWWRMPRLGIGLPNNPLRSLDGTPPDPMNSQGEIIEFLNRKVLTVEDVRKPEGLVHKLNALGITAEIIYILRPLIYAFLVYWYSRKRAPRGGSSFGKSGGGRRSANWTPWLVGISLEYIARQLAFKAQRDNLPGGLRSLTKLEAEEYKQRAVNFGWWMIRGAMYENWTR